MKLILISFILSIPLYLVTFPFVSTLPTGTPEFTDKEIIDNSIVQLKVSSPGTARASGSGVMIKIDNKIKVLTNAHVCLAYQLVNVKKNGKKINPSFTYGVHNRHETAYIDVNLNELSYELDEDWCLIPYDKVTNYPVIDQSFLSDQVDSRVFSLTYNHRNSTNKPLSVFKACLVQEDKKDCKATVKEGGKQGLGVYDKNNKLLTKLNLKTHYRFSFPTIPGDSGSPFFNTQGKLVGLVAGRVMKKDNPKQTKWSIVTSIPSFMKKFKK